jgi:hypothetical protein
VIIATTGRNCRVSSANVRAIAAAAIATTVGQPQAAKARATQLFAPLVGRSLILASRAIGLNVKLCPHATNVLFEDLKSVMI